MNAVAVIGMGLGGFLMYEAFKNQLDPLTLLKSLLTSTPAPTQAQITAQNVAATQGGTVGPGSPIGPLGGLSSGSNPLG